MIKFSKILEQNESSLINDIKNIFGELLDLGLKMDIYYLQGYYVINVLSEKNIKEINQIEFIKDLSVIDDRMNDIGLYFKSVSVIKIEQKNAIIENLRYYEKNKKDIKDKDSINTWEEFKMYCNAILGIDGIQGKFVDDGNITENHEFRINVAEQSGWPRTPEYHGWEINTYDTSKEDFIKEYPGYEEFLEKVLDRKINYDGLWGRKTNAGNNSLGFDKEGIEVVEKLLEMAKDFPDKIEVIKF
jgi:hypothetical protein